MATDEGLPGEIDPETQEAAVKAWGLKLVRDSIPTTDDVFLAQVLALYHEEWERRTGERWVVADD